MRCGYVIQASAARFAKLTHLVDEHRELASEMFNRLAGVIDLFNGTSKVENEESGVSTQG
jgi:hypothetical protein